MSLLPKSHTEFGQADYWEGFFKRRGEKAFEWYGEYGELCGILHKYIKTSDKVLNVGCGNSSLSADLYDVGYRTITNIDISDVVIRQMTNKNKDRSEMSFRKMDVFQMDFTDNEYSVVLDKGTLDAILTDEKEDTLASVNRMFGEISRVLRIGGRYVCISLAQEHIVRKVLSYFTESGWMVRVCRVHEDEEAAAEKEFHMPVFVFVLTKFKKMPNMKPILEVSYFDSQTERYDTIEKVADAIKEMQHYGVIRQQLNQKSQVGKNISLDLCSAVSNTPRYTLHVVDLPQRSTNRFAIFIVPEGRETEWLFATDAGRKDLAKSASFDRLVVVLLHRDHTYGDLDSIKQELSAKVMELAPPGLGDNKQVPFLSVGNDIHKRTVRYRAKSELSGEFVVEDVDSDNQMYRRLIFLSNSKLVQSSARLKKEVTRAKKGSKKKTRTAVDLSHLCCCYHGVMVAGLAVLPDCQKRIDAGASVCIVGLGGGGLPMFLHKYFPTLRIDTVEIDPSMVTLANEWFDFVQDDHLKIHIADGLQYVRKEAAAGTKYDVIMLDVNSSDPSLAMSSPPKAFLDIHYLQDLKSLLNQQGLLMINIACCDTTLRKSVMDDIKSVFPTLYCQYIPDEVNEVIFALQETEAEPMDSKKPLVDSLKTLQQSLQAQSKGAEMPRLADKLKSLTLL